MTLDALRAQELAPTGRLRAALNMANVVLAHSRTAAEQPAGVTIDLSRELASRLAVALDFLEYAAPGDVVQALAEGRADVGFLAVDPHRARDVHFTAPYVQIEGCYLVREGSPLQEQAEVDRPGTDVIVIATSAYDLHLTRTLQHARLVRLPDGQQVLQALLDGTGRAVVAGVRQALLADAARVPGLRLLRGHFMAILQAMVLPRDRGERARTAVEAFITEMAASGFVADALRRHGMEGATVVSGSDR